MVSRGDYLVAGRLHTNSYSASDPTKALTTTGIRTKSRIGQDTGHFRGGPSSPGVRFVPNSETIISLFFKVRMLFTSAIFLFGYKKIIRVECLPSKTIRIPERIGFQT